MRILLSSSIALCLLAIGCSEETKAAGKEALENAGKDLKRAGQDLADLMKLGRDEFTKTVENQLANLDAKIEELEAKSAPKVDAAMEQLKQLREKAAQRIDELQKSGGEAWRDLRQGVANSLEDLRKKIDAEGGTEQKQEVR